MAFASKSLRCRDLPLTALTSFALLFGILRLQAFNLCNMLIFGAITVPSRPSSLMQGTLANYGASRLRCYQLTGIQLTSRVIQHQTCCLRERCAARIVGLNAASFRGSLDDMSTSA